MNATAVTKLDEYLQKARKHFEQWNEEQVCIQNFISIGYTPYQSAFRLA